MEKCENDADDIVNCLMSCVDVVGNDSEERVRERNGEEGMAINVVVGKYEICYPDDFKGVGVEVIGECVL
eukprot:CAMPEP_0118667276 /NCGR_PEP_ID=MMETSP0785-20121206/19697_1 /TAXON_ID=91992 /ORGANISM="Bolidomonas pacifica, Strain CCMP 1866" /LENGTH=69 /DNA_ID=CAMNT_0006561713 /DNA_START=12 /DNA_END=217 /DNA_ORIENTATION=-